MTKLSCTLTALLAGVIAGAVPTVARADEKKVVAVQVKNEGKEPIFVHIDKTGRMGDNVEADAVTGTDGKPAARGKVIEPGASKSFGVCLGLGDFPTLHATRVDVKAKKLTEDKPFSDKMFNPLDYVKIDNVPTLNAVFDGEFKVKK